MREQLDRYRLQELINPGFYDSGEQKEGSSAFMEKRAPDFSAYR
jgi:1,4-dihydroxy-2-naphthoyl-CoA synthase